MISVSIVSFNEYKTLKDCLRSVRGFADEIIVLEMGSTDETKKVCDKFGARVYSHKKVPFVELLRNLAIAKTTGDWILILDPDERLSEALKNKLREIVKKNKDNIVNIPRKNIFFGRWILHTNWWPDRHIRFFKRGMVKWIEKIHSYPQVSGKVLNLEAKEDLAIIHLGYDSISQFIDRQNRYSTIEAYQLYAKGSRFSLNLFLWKPLREFLVRFVKHKGFLDGFYGFTLTFLMMVYQLMVFIKLWELDKKNK